MNHPGTTACKNRSLHKFLPLALAALACGVTGCPHNQYLIQLKPQGSHIERTLVFYREDGVDTNTSIPNYLAFDATELAAITALYPANGLTNEGQRHTVRGEFASALPADVGGAGVYTNLSTRLGEAGFYVERFRGDDDLTGMSDRRDQSADRLADLIVGWSQSTLGREPGYLPLHRFLNVELRQDLKNLGAYGWEGQLVGGYRTNGSEEFMVRFGQYLLERGYFSLGDIPGVFRDASNNDDAALLRRIQRLIARRMDVPDSDPVPAALDFLADATRMEKSFDEYLAGTDLYRDRLKQWAAAVKLKPDLKRPEPEEVAGDAFKDLIEFNSLGEPDHVVIRLSLPAPPVHSNGQWEEARRQVVWEADLQDRTNSVHLPLSGYASWAEPDREYQLAHFGGVILIGDALAEYCLWRSGQDQQTGGEWDAFIASLQPDRGLTARLDAFRFAVETKTTGSNQVPSRADYPRNLLKNALPPSDPP